MKFGVYVLADSELSRNEDLGPAELAHSEKEVVRTEVVVLVWNLRLKLVDRILGVSTDQMRASGAQTVV